MCVLGEVCWFLLLLWFPSSAIAVEWWKGGCLSLYCGTQVRSCP